MNVWNCMSLLRKQLSNVIQKFRFYIADSEDDKWSHIYRRKSRLELIRISAAVMGIEFCYAAETAFVSPTLLKIGISHSHMTLVWCLSPLIGFFLTPILGSLSDQCQWSWGRRRPFILALSVGIVLGLILVPNGKDFGIAMGDYFPEMPEYSINFSNTTVNTNTTDRTSSHQEAASTITISNSSHPWSIFFTVIGTVLLDFNSDACQSPSRAYMLDVTAADDHATGLSTFTVMAGLGGALGYTLGALNWETHSTGTTLSSHIKSLFTIVIFIYITCVMVTITSFREMPLNVRSVRRGHQMSSDDNASQSTTDKRAATLCQSDSGNHQYKRFFTDVGIDNDCDADDVNLISESKECITSSKRPYGAICQESDSKIMETSFRDDGAAAAAATNETIEQKISGSADDDDGLMPITQHPEINLDEVNVSFMQYLSSIIHLPNFMKILCLTNLFCWMSIVSYSLYFTDFVGDAVFGGDPMAEKDSYSRQLYENGVRFGCWGMAVYSLSCASYSLVIDKLISAFHAKPVYIGGQLVYCFGMAMLAISRHKAAVIIMSCTTGIMYATLFTMPYILVAHYHNINAFATPQTNDDAGYHQKKFVRGIGTDVAIVSSMIFLAQFLLSAFMGTIVNVAGSTVAVVILASALSFCGALCATQVEYFNL